MLTALQGQAPAAEESRREGSTLLLRCPYAAQQSQQLKGWGRLTGGQWEVLLETTPPQNSSTTQSTMGRVSVRDNSTSRLVTVVVTNLQAEDSGSYCCTLRSPLPSSRPLPLKIISLNVFKEVHRWELDTVSVQCKYRAVEDRATPKVWCRRGPRGCQPWLRTEPSWAESRALEGRALIQDDPQGGIVTVTMRNLQAQDAGTYWCALHRAWQPARIMELRLYVSKRTKHCRAKEAEQLSVQCLYNPSEHRPVSKAWCRKAAGEPCSLLLSTEVEAPGRLRTSQRGRVAIQDDSLQGIVTVTVSSLQAQDSGVYWCALREQDGLLRMAEVVLSVPGGNRGGESSCGKPEDVAQVGSPGRVERARDESKDLNYATLTFGAQPSPEGALYCNLEPGQAHRGPRAEDVQYAIIGLQQLPASGKG
ncbi:polymeric immunoglobulin receptor-like [Dryobates pubescens]|uniref:polymeric immunoglobulin receptor-like n=1 Tax=Dryobates pubescens TaxID=118200 RepID=UPI0023BA146D|nr:polymeric immunoglobulin receptor-like [Dryobates pubescens]